MAISYEIFYLQPGIYLLGVPVSAAVGSAAPHVEVQHADDGHVFPIKNSYTTHRMV